MDTIKNKYKENKYKTTRCIIFNLLSLKKEAQAKKKKGTAIRQSIAIGPICINDSPIIEAFGKQYSINRTTTPII
ncbi:Uncharacterised protein [Streptococcus pneumoniae]|nr:Uncharacterised protein [Streptococcus pneumoniae]